MRTRSKLIPACAAFAIAAGCSGRVGTPPIVPAAPRVAAPTLSETRVSIDAGGRGTVRFALTLAAASTLRGHAAPPSTSSVKVDLTSVDGATPIIQRTITFSTLGAPSCTNAAPVVCSGQMVAPVGYDGFSVTLYAGPHATGKSLARSNADVAVRAGKTMTVNLVPNGIIAKLVPEFERITPFANGKLQRISDSISALDENGAVIVGPGRFTTPIEVTISNDPQVALSIAPSMIYAPGSDGSETAHISYASSATLVHGVVTFTAGKVSAHTAIDPFVITPRSIGGMLRGATTESQTLTLSEYGSTQPFTVSGGGNGVQANCVPATCVPTNATSDVRVTLTPMKSAIGTLHIADASGTKVSLPFAASTLTLYPDLGSAGVQALAPSFDALWTLTQSGTLASITDAGAESQYPLAQWSGSSSPSMVLGPDGNFWYADGTTHNLTKVIPTGTQTFFSTPDGGTPLSVAVGSDHNLWFTESSDEIIKATIDGVMTQYVNVGGSEATGMIAGPDRNLWFIQNASLYRITTQGVITPFLGLLDKNGAVISVSQIAVGPDNLLWLAQSNGEICRFSTNGTLVGCIQTTVQPATMIAAQDGAVWAAGRDLTTGGNAIDRIVPPGSIFEYAMPANGAFQPFGSAIKGADDLWLANGSGGIDELQLAIPATAALKE